MRFRYQAPLSMFTGYGRLGCWLGQRFLRMWGVSPDIVPHRGHIDNDIPSELLKAARRPHHPHRTGLLVSVPYEVHLLPAFHRIVYTMWETTRIPPSYIGELNNASAIVVPSTFCAYLFREQTHTVVYNVGCGVDTAMFEYGDDRDTSVFTVGSIGKMSLRKGIDVLMRAWSIALGDKDDARLLVKTHGDLWCPNHAEMAPNVFIVNQVTDSDSITSFYHKLDLLVMPTRADAYLLPPVEAACCGVPSYVTNWGGPRDYIERYIRPIQIDGLYDVPEGVMGASGAGQWAEPSLDDLVSILEMEYNASRQTERERQRVSAWGKGSFDIGIVADRIRGILGRYK